MLLNPENVRVPDRRSAWHSRSAISISPGCLDLRRSLARRVSAHNNLARAGFALSVPEEFRFKSFDGTRDPGLVDETRRLARRPQVSA